VLAGKHPLREQEMTSDPKKSAVRTRRAIVNLLKQTDAMDSQDLAAHLGVSAMAIRQHLYALQAEKLVTYSESGRPMGRPVKLWRLTPAANRLFPDGYAELTLGLLESAREAFGEEGLNRLLDLRTAHQLAAYEAQIHAEAELSQKLARLANLRTTEGYMAEVQCLEDGSFLMVENHCPICAAATVCTGLCERELQIFQQVLGHDIERTEHIVAGSRRCAYRIPAEATAP